MLALMLLMRIVSKFCMKEVFKCSDRRMIYWDEEWTKSQDWGYPRHPLVLHQSVSGHLSCTMFLFVHAISAISWSVRCFSFQYCVVCFVLLNKRVDPSKVCFGERHAPLSLSRILLFSISLSCECSLFLVLRLGFHFMF